MYRFFKGRFGTDREKFICQIEPANPLCPYTEPQIGDIVNLPFGANELDRRPYPRYSGLFVLRHWPRT